MYMCVCRFKSLTGVLSVDGAVLAFEINNIST